MAQQAIGMIETKGLCALLKAADSALKAANVQFVGWEKIGSGYVTAFFEATSRPSKPPLPCRPPKPPNPPKRPR